jgi:protein gp37
MAARHLGVTEPPPPGSPAGVAGASSREPRKLGQFAYDCVVADRSGIEWTESTWNPTTGCDRTSPGCDNCYALTLAARLKAMGQPKYQRDGDDRTSGPGFALTLHDDALDIPRRWRQPRFIFVNSMSDLFHKDVPMEFIRRVFDVMASTPQHTYQLLTKRSRRLHEIAGKLEWPANVWMGVSVESDRYAFRTRDLVSTPAAVKFLSCEPLIGPLPSLDLDRVDWVIVGGESGPGARPMDLAWVREIADRCDQASVPLFVKQLGTAWSIDAGLGRTHGGDWSAWPHDLRRRVMPEKQVVVAS